MAVDIRKLKECCLNTQHRIGKKSKGILHSIEIYSRWCGRTTKNFT